MKKLLLIALLIVGCEKDSTSPEPEDCAGEIDKHVELWGVCYNIEETTELDLSWSWLTGEIPSEIGNLTNLKDLFLSSNQLTGEIPPEIGNLTNLTSLSLSYNQLTGEIPSEIGNLTNLTKLDLQFNQLTGEIPSEIMTNLEEFYVNNNQFSGLIPETICNMNVTWFNPHVFDISGNQLVPPYPDCVSYFVEYQYSEECESNYLFNGICTEPSDLDVLQQFVDNSAETINMGMDDNNNGLIEPIELGTQWWVDGRLAELNCNYDLANEYALGDLGLSGNIPPEIGNLESMEFLWLEDNQLTGPIPSGIGNLEHLRYLILHYNQISGPIPSEIGNLSNLEILKLDNNQLTGFIPDSICNLTLQFHGWNNLFGENFAVYNNQLCPPYPDCVDEYVGLQDTSNCAQTSVSVDPIPLDYRLFEPYPNPFNAQTTIEFSLPLKDVMTIKVHDISGKEVRSLVHGIFDSGEHKVHWNASNLSSGIYFIRMESRHFVDTKKISLIK